MKITILNTQYNVLDTIEKITIADSFVVRSNKIGTGNGEAKLYVGQDNQHTLDFFGSRGFKIECFLLKSDLLKYLEETKVEYLNPEQPYNFKGKLPELWQERYKEINQLDDIVAFNFSDNTKIKPPRVYGNSSDDNYQIIRELSLPNITYISILKL